MLLEVDVVHEHLPDELGISKNERDHAAHILAEQFRLLACQCLLQPVVVVVALAGHVAGILRRGACEGHELALDALSSVELHQPEWPDDLLEQKQVGQASQNSEDENEQWVWHD